MNTQHDTCAVVGSLPAVLPLRVVATSALVGLVAAISIGFQPVPAADASGSNDPTVAFRNCGDRTKGPTQCARVRVPLDRSGAVAGDVQLAVRRLQPGRKRVARRRQAVLFLAGGPGQATTTLLTDVAPMLKPLLKHRDLLTIDTRGTGRSSDLIVCPELEALTATVGVDPSLIASCARRLGSAASNYATSDVIADIEAVRRASGYRRLLIVGVSYGTYTAQRYAAAYPRRVSGLVLDSSVDVTGDDPFSLAMYRAIPRVLTHACERGACRGVTTDPRGDLARTLARAPIRAKVDGGRGRRVTTLVRDDTVAGLVFAGDFDPLLRASLPGALRRAAQGDGAPLARMAREVGLIQLPDDDQDPSAISGGAGSLSTGAYVATTCRDTRYPWADVAPGPARIEAAQRALAGTTADRRGGFSVGGIVADWPVGLCALWPSSPDTAPVPPLPAVPTLFVSGRDDARTPPEVARAIARRAPKSTLVTVPGQGHSVLTENRGCVRRALRAFAAGRSDTRCTGTKRPPTAAPLVPRSVSALGRTRTERARGVARATVHDAVRTLVIRVAQSAGEGIVLSDETPTTVRVAGLRSGSAVLTTSGVRLERFGFVPGTAVSGALSDEKTVRVRVRGRGLRTGTYRIPNPIADSETLRSELGLDGEIVIELQARVRRAIQRLTAGRH